jgi:hypothetical protein
LISACVAPLPRRKAAAYVLEAGPKDLSFLTNDLDGKAHGIEPVEGTWRPSLTTGYGMGCAHWVMHGVCDMARKLVEVENANHPGQVRLVDAAMYDAMKRTLLRILPRTRPGLTVDEIYAKVATQLPKDLFPAGAKSGWWAKTVQLDLEAKGMIARDKTRPLRLRRL